MCFLVLNRAIGRASQYGYLYGKRLVGQHGAIGITRYSLVINAVQTALCLRVARNNHQV